VTADILPPETAPATGALALTPAGQAALAAAQALARKATAPATLRAYKADLVGVPGPVDLQRAGGLTAGGVAIT
jgi:hypothetical protein